MLCLCVFLYFLVLGRHECSQPDENFIELRHAEWKCDTVCEGSGGKAAFDLKNKICKCALDKNTDGVEEQLILKDAKVLGVPLVITKNKVKRQAINDPVVGQRAPQRIIAPRLILQPSKRPFRLSTKRALPGTFRLTTPRINTGAKYRLQQIQNRIKDRKKDWARKRPGPHLQQRSGFPDDSQPNLLERLRQIQKERQEKQRNKTASTTAAPNIAASASRKGSSLNSSPIIGSSRNTIAEDDKPTSVEAKGDSKKPSFEVITQPSSLYDEDD